MMRRLRRYKPVSARRRLKRRKTRRKRITNPTSTLLLLDKIITMLNL